MRNFVDWVIEERIVFANIEGDLSIEEWADLCSHILEHIESTSYHVHIIFDFLNMGKHPINVVKIHEAAVWAGHERVESVNYLTHSALIKFLGSSVMSKAFVKRFDRVTTLEEAFSNIKGVDTSITQSLSDLQKATDALRQKI
ncbi:MAG: hypothetical protein AAFR81_10600 [Chloroflexota bacterium]